MQDSKNTNKDNIQPTVPGKEPDEKGGVVVQGHIKIFDPQTKEVLVSKRA